MLDRWRFNLDSRILAALKKIDILASRLAHLETLETLGSSHDHDGGDGAQIPETGLTSAVQAKLNDPGVTGGDAHDHSGGDGAVIPESGLAAAVQAQLVTNGDSHDHSGGDGAVVPESGLASAVQSQLVTNGDSHNHSGGDGAVIPESGLASAVQDQLVTGGDSHTHSSFTNVTASGDVEAGGGIAVGYTGANPATGRIEIYEGSTRVGDIDATDTTWLRFNQNTSKNMYTPQSMAIATGFAVGTSSLPGTGVVRYTNNLQRYISGSTYNMYGAHFFTSHTSPFNGSNKSSSTGSVSVSSYGCPSSSVAVLVRVACIESQAWPKNSYFSCGPSSGDPYAVIARSFGTSGGVGMAGENSAWCPVSSGTLNWKAVAAGASSLQVWLFIYGYAV